MASIFTIELASYKNKNVESLDALETALSDRWTEHVETEELPYSSVFEHAFTVEYDALQALPEERLTITADDYLTHILDDNPADDHPQPEAYLFGHWRSTTSPYAKHLPRSMQRTPTKKDEFLKNTLDELYLD